MAKVGTLKHPETKEKLYPVTYNELVIGHKDGTVKSITAGSGLNTTSGDTITDGGAINVNGSLHLSKCNSNPGSFGPSADASPNAGGTIVVPQVTVDKHGRATSVVDRNITLPTSMWSSMVDYTTISELKPIHFISCLFHDMFGKSTTNDNHVLSYGIQVLEAGSSDGPSRLPIALFILLYGAYLHKKGFKSGRLVVETYDRLSDSKSRVVIVGANDSNCYRFYTSDALSLSSNAILTANNAKLFMSNWNGYDAYHKLPNHSTNDFTQSNAAMVDNTSHPISGTSTYVHNKYTFTFMGMSAGDNIGDLCDIVDTIAEYYSVGATDLYHLLYDHYWGYFNSIAVACERTSSGMYTSNPSTNSVEVYGY